MRWIVLFSLFLRSFLNALDTGPGTTCTQYEGCFGHLHPATPCFNPSDPCSFVLICDASLLAWQAKEEGLAFALKNSASAPLARSNINGSLIDLEFNWEPAGKVNLGIVFPDRSWDFDVRWTFFYTHSQHVSHAIPNINSKGLLPLWVLPNFTTPNIFSISYATAKASWQLHLNTYDIELGYHAFLTPCLSFRLDGGLKGVFIHQRFRVSYEGGISPQTIQPLASQTVFKNNSWGIGPRIGFDSKWRLGYGISFLGTIASTLSLSQFEVTRKDFNTGVLGGLLQTKNSFFKESVWVVRPVLETSLGFSWDTYYGCKQQYSFGILANYELQYFWEQNLMGMLVDESLFYNAFQPRGDLHFHGATLTFHFGY